MRVEALVGVRLATGTSEHVFRPAKFEPARGEHLHAPVLLLNRAPLAEHFREDRVDRKGGMHTAFALDAQRNDAPVAIEQAVVPAQVRDLRVPRAGVEERRCQVVRQALAVRRLLLVEKFEQPGQVVRLQIADGWGTAAFGRLDFGERVWRPIARKRTPSLRALHRPARSSAPTGGHHLPVKPRCRLLGERHRIQLAHARPGKKPPPSALVGE